MQIASFVDLRKICLLVASALLYGCGGVEFHSWEGQQQKCALVDNRYALPTYYGYPPRPYIVLGVVQTSTKRIDRFAVLSYAASRAKAMGADAILAMPRTAEEDTPNPFGTALGSSLTPTTDRGFFAKATVVAIKWKN